MRFQVLFPLCVLGVVGSCYATHIQLQGRTGSSSANVQRRSAMTGTIAQLGDSQNIPYTTNVTMNGASLSILIDTGSSDLFVSSQVPGAVSQNYQASVSYAAGSAQGDVMSADMEFAGFSIQSQFFIEAPNADAATGADGLIGLGPSSGSSIRYNGNSSAANPPLDRIFTSNTSISPFIAILLQRSDDPEEPYPGDLSIGEVLSQYQDIYNAPKHPVTTVSLNGGQHWQILLDENGIIGPNGQPISIKTQVTGAQSNNATVVFDTGFTLPQVPPYVAEALYSDIPGSVLTNLSGIGEIWVLPCDQEVNATFLFGGVEFPIHPLDLNFDGFDLQANGEAYCVGAFQPYSFDIVEDGEVLFDMILGMAFLRNAYMLVNFGNLLNAATPSSSTAYIQLLPITNGAQAAQDFASVRQGGASGDANGDELGSLFHSSSSSSSSSGTTYKTNKLAPWIIGVIVGGAVLLILFVSCIWCCCFRRRNKHKTAPTTNVWTGYNARNYRPVNEPSPEAAYDVHMTPSAAPGYTPAYVPEYKTAWDSHH
ncbi:aspartic peptidase domain-containing protein [Phlebopus sp. FC_14]|nr:aspartic peptidase domain-containing protein [Phlebopus sp. FC_14]